MSQQGLTLPDEAPEIWRDIGLAGLRRNRNPTAHCPHSLVEVGNMAVEICRPVRAGSLSANLVDGNLGCLDLVYCATVRRRILGYSKVASPLGKPARETVTDAGK